MQPVERQLMSRRGFCCQTLLALLLLPMSATAGAARLCHADPNTSDLQDTALSAAACKDRGGYVLNTLNSDHCDQDTTPIGAVTGVRCPCICCAPPPVE